ncbi:MAG: glycerate kinase [Deltaproteobacteria bacterium]|nr:MAG: glycerate kinase [Deltaproteobacteria bacterium]
MSSLTELRAHARNIFFAALDTSDPCAAVKKNLQLRTGHLQVAGRNYDLSRIHNLIVVGCGKAAARMALAIQELLGARVSDGLVIVKYGCGIPLEKIAVVEAGHPIPDAAGLDGARRIVEMVQTAGERDLVIFLVSGGGSALFPYPADDLSLADKQQTTEVLLKSGATIQEVNAVRKHLSRLKGGQFAQLVAPAQLITLILSDVVGDSLEAIASGPTVADSSTYGDCLQILRRYDIERSIPPAAMDYLARGARGEVAETPKPSDTIFEMVRNVIVGSNRLAVDAARRRAEELGYSTMILSDSIEGESRIVARSHSALVKEIARTSKPIPRPACVISGGETTVTVRGDGLGGRNQEFSLAAAIEIDGLENIVVLSAGTDGIDGPTDAAGGLVDGATVSRGRTQGLEPIEYLARNDSYHFLQSVGDLFITGPTLTNVMDLQIALIA